HKVAQEALAAQQPRSLVLDTQHDDDVIFGSGSGCRGAMHLLVVPVIPDQQNILYGAIVESNSAHQTLTLAVFTDYEHCGMGLGWRGDSYYRFGASSNSLQSLERATQGQHSIALDDGETVVANVFVIAPPPRIVVIGASVETPSLIRIAHSLGWQVTVVDHRSTQLEKVSAIADHVVAVRPAAALSDHIVFDAALVMSHSAMTDIEALQTLALRNEKYIGLLGPPARRDELLSQLTDMQRSSLMLRLHAPMGLRLGGHGPEALALSILSELQQFISEIENR
ncbi:MAG: XdhC family protein, partial [Steroidobacter sp.]